MSTERRSRLSQRIQWRAAPRLLTLAGCGGSGGSQPASGSATISGTVGGKTFDKVASACLIAQRDDPAHTTTIHVFDAPVACADIDAPGRDTSIAGPTGALEMKLIESRGR